MHSCSRVSLVVVCLLVCGGIGLVGGPVAGETILQGIQVTEVELTHAETAEPYGEFEITVTTDNPTETVIEVDPTGFGVRLSSEDPVEVELNRVTLAEQEDGSSTYTITVDIIGGTEGDTGEIAVWVASQDQDNPDRVAVSTVKIVEDSSNNETDGNSTDTVSVTGETDSPNNGTINGTDETDSPSNTTTLPGVDSGADQPSETDSSSNTTSNQTRGTSNTSNGGSDTTTILAIVGFISTIVIGYYTFGATKTVASSVSIERVALIGAGKVDEAARNPQIMYRISISIKNSGIEPTTISSITLQTAAETIELYNTNGPDGTPIWNDVTVENRSELSLKGFGENQTSLGTVSGEIIVNSTHHELRKQVDISPAMKF